MKKFNEFDESIGVDGYYKIIKSWFFPNSTQNSIDISSFNLEEQIYPKGSVFSRVRYISENEANYLNNWSISKHDFYPPRPTLKKTSQGRFNAPEQRTLYLADHPMVAIKECNIKSGDFFLLAYIETLIDMCFISLEESTDEKIMAFIQMVKSEDTRFYPVIDRIAQKMFTFESRHGFTYSTVKNLDDLVVRHGSIDSKKNIAILERYIKKTKLNVAWLGKKDDEGNIVFYTIFQPLSNKKKNKIKTTSILKEPAKFEEKHKNALNKLNEMQRKTKLLLDKGRYSDFSGDLMQYVEK